MSIDFKKVEKWPQISSLLERGAKSSFMYFMMDKWG